MVTGPVFNSVAYQRDAGPAVKWVPSLMSAILPMRSWVQV